MEKSLQIVLMEVFGAVKGPEMMLKFEENDLNELDLLQDLDFAVANFLGITPGGFYKLKRKVREALDSIVEQKSPNMLLKTEQQDFQVQQESASFQQESASFETEAEEPGFQNPEEIAHLFEPEFIEKVHSADYDTSSFDVDQELVTKRCFAELKRRCPNGISGVQRNNMAISIETCFNKVLGSRVSFFP